MSHFVSCFTAQDEFGNEVQGAALYTSHLLRKRSDGSMKSRTYPSLVAFGSSKEAALLALRASLQAAVGAVEMEVLHHRDNQIRVVDRRLNLAELRKSMAVWPELDEDEDEDDIEDADEEEGDADGD